MNMFLGYDWLVKYNPEVNWNKETMQFMKCPRICKTKYQDVSFLPRN